MHAQIVGLVSSNVLWRPLNLLNNIHSAFFPGFGIFPGKGFRFLSGNIPKAPGMG
jgi:hypothetical protein